MDSNHRNTRVKFWGLTTWRRPNKMVEEAWFEQARSKDGRFTVCCDPPTSPLFQKWSEWEDSNLQSLEPKSSAVTRLGYIPIKKSKLLRTLAKCSPNEKFLYVYKFYLQDFCLSWFYTLETKIEHTPKNKNFLGYSCATLRLQRHRFTFFVYSACIVNKSSRADVFQPWIWYR